MSEWLRRIPASHSEARAIMGLDPTTLAQLGLNDAKKAVQIDPSSTSAYAQEVDLPRPFLTSHSSHRPPPLYRHCFLVKQGAAQMLLERYEEAVESYMAGLAVDPLNEELQSGLNSAQQHLAGSRPTSPAPAAAPQAGGAKRRRVSSAEDAECSLCMKLLYEPVTTPCGASQPTMCPEKWPANAC